MGRTQLSEQRLSAIQDVNIGKIIIFCEGKTEKYYFKYFADILEKNNKYTDVKVVLESANGNARTVLNLANNFMAKEENNQKFSIYDKYLVFDCDDPPDIQNVINESAGYELLISNYLFEVWLLMHFEDVNKKMSKREIYSRLSWYLNDKYKKGQKGKTREIIQNGNIEKAIDNAKMLEESYTNVYKNVFTDVKDMNPYTNVYKLIEQFMVAISQ